MTLAPQSHMSFAFAAALACSLGCAEDHGTANDVAAALETGEGVEKSMSGAAQYTAPWAEELFSETAEFYVYKDGDLVRGAVIFSDEEICQFDSATLVDGRIRILSQNCSGAINGATLDSSCRVRQGDLVCQGVLTTDDGETGTGAVYSVIVHSPDGPYEGPFDPSPDEDGDCEGASPCGASGCCEPGQRCGDGQCWDPVEDDAETEEQE